MQLVEKHMIDQKDVRYAVIDAAYKPVWMLVPFLFVTPVYARQP
jgi:hypothetical protein